VASHGGAAIEHDELLAAGRRYDVPARRAAVACRAGESRFGPPNAHGIQERDRTRSDRLPRRLRHLDSGAQPDDSRESSDSIAVWAHLGIWIAARPDSVRVRLRHRDVDAVSLAVDVVGQRRADASRHGRVDERT
jgi:hypothetical protein